MDHITVNSTDGRSPETNFWKQIYPKLKQINVPIYMFAGDVGANATGNEISVTSVDHLMLIASGMGGGKRDNYLSIDVDDLGKVDITIVPLQGEKGSMGKIEDYNHDVGQKE